MTSTCLHTGLGAPQPERGSSEMQGCMLRQMEDINLLGKRDVVTLSTAGGAIVDWSIIGAPPRPQIDTPALIQPRVSVHALEAFHAPAQTKSC